MLPGTTANSDFNPGDMRRSGPCDTANRQVALLNFAVGLRLGDQTPHALQRYRLSHYLFAPLPLKEVCFGLVMTTEQLTAHLNLGEPFDGCHGIPPRNDDSQRIAMLNRERLPVHGVGKQRLRPPSVVHAQAALEANWFATRIKFAAVSASKYYLSRIPLNTCPVQNLREWHPRPFGCANGSQVPLLPVHTRAQQ